MYLVPDSGGAFDFGSYAFDALYFCLSVSVGQPEDFHHV